MTSTSSPPPVAAPESSEGPPAESTFLGELVWLDPRRWLPLLAEVPKEIWVVSVVGAVGLTLHELVFLPSRAGYFIREWFPALHQYLSGSGADWRGLVRFAWWSGGSMLVWVVLPLLVSWLVLRRPPTAYGLARLPLRKTAPYLAILAFMVPVVLFAALFLPGFTKTYPFYRPASGAWTLTAWLLFELIYGLQFLTVEFFFRGYLLQGFARHIGYRAILVSMMPYVMVHFHKPITEALAAIIAGVVLGAFALRTRTIWGGLLIHLGVAYSMDFISLATGAHGGFPTKW